MTTSRDGAQAWIELRTDDPDAWSALATARSRLAAGRTLAALRRFRLFELAGATPGRGALEDLLHRSTWFYNPHKERCTVRTAARDRTPLDAAEVAVLVVERDGERRGAAERWWRHETGATVEVCEATVWALRFEHGEDVAARAAELAELHDPGHGLLCNPHSQRWALAERPPLAWIRRTAEAAAASKGVS